MLNNQVKLLVYESSSQTTVEINGTAKLVNDNAETRKAFNHIQKIAMQTSISGDMPIAKLDAGPFVTYKIDPIDIQMGIYVRPEPNNYDMFERVDLST